MNYYYDIDLCFKDNYDHYYNWSDEITHVFKIPIYKVDSLGDIILNEVIIDSDYKYIIVSDSINAVALELADYRSKFISSLKYKDESRVVEIVNKSKCKKIDYSIYSKRDSVISNRLDFIKKIFINEINNNDIYYIKYLYYEITGKRSEDINFMRGFLLNDVNTNFSLKYINVYEFIYN